MASPSPCYFEGTCLPDRLSCERGQPQQMNLSFLKSRFWWCQAILRRCITSAVAVTISSLLGCKNSASWSAKVPLSQSSCTGYRPDDGRRTAAENPWEKKGKGHWADAQGEVISAERKEKPARPGQASPHFLPILPRERANALPAHRGGQVKLESDQSSWGKEGKAEGQCSCKPAPILAFSMWLQGNSQSSFSLCFCLFPREVIFANKYLMSAKHLGSTKTVEVFVPQPSPQPSLSPSGVGAEPALEIGQARHYHPFHGTLPHGKISGSHCCLLWHVSRGLLFCPGGFSGFDDWFATFVTGASQKKSKHSDLSLHALSINLDVWFLTVLPVASRPYLVRLCLNV